MLEIELGLLAEFANSHRFWGLVVIFLPVTLFGLMFLYGILKRVPGVKQLLQNIGMSLGFTCLPFIPTVAACMLLDVPRLKIIVIFVGMYFIAFAFTTFNRRELVRFFKELGHYARVNQP